MWFAITDIYDNTTHIDSYLHISFHKISYIKFFDKISDKATISNVFNKRFADLREYEYSGWTPEALDEITCLTIINFLIKLVADLRRHIKICGIVENKGILFISQQVMYTILEYAKVPITIQSYAKSQSCAK